MSFQSTISEIKKGKINSLYCLFGEEDYLIRLFEKTIGASIFPEGIDPLNFTKYDAEEVSLESILSDAIELPFFGDKKLLIVQNALFFASKPKKAESKDTLDALNAYMENPAEETVLIFYTPKKLDGKKKIVKTLKKQGVVLDLEDHTDGTVKNIVADYLKNEKVEIDKYALEELLNRTHYSLTQSMNEAEKIAGFSTGVRITIKDVQSLVPKSLEQNVFELSSSIMAGHTDRALQTLQDLLLNGETVIGLNSLLLEQIRLFLQVKILLNARLGEREIASELKVHPYRVKLAVQESRRVEKRVLETGFQSIVQLDEDLKSKNRDDVGSFQQLILKIRGLAGAR